MPYSAALVNAFDGSLNEQCHQYNECYTYAAFAAAGKPTFNAEYPKTVNTGYCGTSFYGVPMQTLQYKSTSLSVSNLINTCGQV